MGQIFGKELSGETKCNEIETECDELDSIKLTDDCDDELTRKRLEDKVQQTGKALTGKERNWMIGYDELQTKEFHSVPRTGIEQLVVCEPCCQTLFYWNATL